MMNYGFIYRWYTVHICTYMITCYCSILFYIVVDCYWLLMYLYFAYSYNYCYLYLSIHIYLYLSTLCHKCSKTYIYICIYSYLRNIMIIPQEGFPFQVPSLSRFVSREVRSPTAPPAASADAALPSAKDAAGKMVGWNQGMDMHCFFKINVESFRCKVVGMMLKKCFFEKNMEIVTILQLPYLVGGLEHDFYLSISYRDNPSHWL